MTGVTDVIAAIEAALDQRHAKKKGNELLFVCPVHQDEHASAQWNPSKRVWNCFACPAKGGWMNLAEVLGVPVPKIVRIALNDLALDKDVPVAFLRSLRLHDLADGGVGIPYRDPSGKQMFIKRRTALKAKEGSYQPKGHKTMAYGLERLGDAKKAGYLIIGEGESDGWVAWHHDLPYLGIPGADNTKVLAREHLDGIGRIYVCREPDQGGDTLVRGVAARLAAIGWQGESLVFTCGDSKDLCDLHRLDCDGFHAALAAQFADATPLESVSAEPPVVAAERKLTFHTAREISAHVPAETCWRAYPWVADGAITEIDGKIKAAGKTTWLLALCRAVLDGKPFMGYATFQTPIVFLTEQAPRTFREALRRAELLERDDFHVLYWHDAAGVDWPVVVAAAVERAKEVGARMLAVDTLGQFAGLKGDAENNAGDALKAVQPLQEAAALHNIGVAFTRHERKAGGEVGDSGRGSSAFAGAVDIVLSIRRPEGNSRPTMRVIHALSRFDETPDSLAIELTDCGYAALGSEQVMAAEVAKETILEIAPASETAAKKLEELIDAAEGVKRTAGQTAVKDLFAVGLLQRVGNGVRGDPHRYWRPDSAETEEKVSAALKDVVSAERKNGVENHPVPFASPDVDTLEKVSAATHLLSAAETNAATCQGCGESLPPGQEDMCTGCWEGAVA